MTLREMSGAEFSEDRAYRHLLWRIWDVSKPLLCLIMLNPSEAGDIESDPTVTRQIERAKRLGCGGLLVVNAFDIVATDPKDMKRHPMPFSEKADISIRRAAERAIESGGIVIVAWGHNAAHLNRHKKMLALLEGIPLYSVAVTKDGFPGHPLYVGYDVAPVRYPCL